MSFVASPANSMLQVPSVPSLPALPPPSFGFSPGRSLSAPSIQSFGAPTTRPAHVSNIGPSLSHGPFQNCTVPTCVDVPPEYAEEEIIGAPSYGVSTYAKVDEIGPPSLRTGVHTLTGVKPGHPNWVNQDCYCEMNLGEGRMFAGVFDGHGPLGHILSSRVKSLFAESAVTLSSASDVTAALEDAFAKIDAQIQLEGSAEDSGTTVTIALVDAHQGTVSIAHVGDSTALLIRPDGCIVYKSEDHKPCNEREAQRLRAHGSQIVNGRLLMTGRPSFHFGLSRAIGDCAYVPQGVNAKPEVVRLNFQPGTVLILASDGVWDMVDKDTAAQIAVRERPQETARRLVVDAKSRWVAMPHVDDITALVVQCAPGEPIVPEYGSFINMRVAARSPASTRMPESPSESSGSRSPIQCSPWRNGSGFGFF